ncbi:MAG: DsrE/DsrF/DrsH-like family protein [Anaerolineae bacterium]|nr:DsrE/DsrF/DrsH-like family protein [Anaerolineae bacterium]MDQ7033603.1 DsrE/DsrF/DrsH-like family protein [Anaerolineae bacterium]
MTTPTLEATSPVIEEKTRKLCIICSKGSLDMAYPPLILANAARMSGIEVDLFFTFWGLDMINNKKVDKLSVTPLGNPSMGIPPAIGAAPGMGIFASHMMKKQIEDLDFPEVREFLEILSDSGAKLYACKMSMDMMKLTDDDLVEGCEVIGAMEFMDYSEGAQVLFV